MADSEHLEILKQDAKAWNRWREENPDIEPDFKGANLRGANLKGRNLAGADFSNADIRSTNFTNANLREAKFCKAKAGLKRRWSILLVLASWLLALISGFLSTFIGYFIALVFDNSSLGNQAIGILSLILVAVFVALTLLEGITSSLVVVAIAIAALETLFATLTGNGALVGNLVGAGAGTLAGALALAGVLAGALALAGVPAGLLAGALALAGAGALAGVLAGARELAGVLAGAFAIVVLYSYMAWEALKENEKYALIRNV